MAPIILNGEVSVGYITAKESNQGHRIYSIELTEIQKLRTKGDILETSNATSAAFNEKLRLVQEKVKPELITIKTDENGEPLASEVARFGRTGTASDWVSFANRSKAYVEGQAANGREIIRLTLDKGVFDYSRQ